MKYFVPCVAALLLAACDNTQPPAPEQAAPEQASVEQAPAQAPSDVRIVRDNYGVPHIYADSIYGLYYGYGYAIAQDRLFQIEMARRSTQGTVAEVLGAEYIDFDTTARRLYSPASIRRQLAEISQDDRDVFDGYAAGLNAWIDEVAAQPAQLLPKQFADLDFMPAQWDGFDVAMVFIGTMANRFGDFNSELENATILQTLVAQHGQEQGLELFNLLNPRFTDDAVTTIPTEDWSRPAYDSLAETQALNLPVAPRTELAAASQTSGFSNVFILGRDKVAGANSILVNGPQFGWYNPSYVYSVGMHGAGIDVVGNTPFGYPMILFGHNERIAWGSTWGGSDIVDMFAEQLNPDNDEQYFYQGEYIDFESRVETILVKDAQPREIEAMRSVHGPIVSVNADEGIAYAKKRSWDGQELKTLLAWLYSTWATDFEEWKSHAEDFAINVNWYYADVDGNIGYFHGGHFPRRAPGHDNRFPAAGDGSMDWQGWQEADTANPHVINPSSGFIANWNNKPGHGVMNPDFFYYGWTSSDRVEILQELIEAQDRFSADEAWSLLDPSSYADVYIEYLLDAIDSAATAANDDELMAANTLLQSWDRQWRDDNGDGSYDAEASTLFRAFLGALVEQTLADDLGEAYPFFAAIGYPTAEAPTASGTNLTAGTKAVIEVLEGNDSYDLFNGASPESAIVNALHAALEGASEEDREVVSRPFYPRNFLGIPQADASELMVAPIEQNRGTENNMIVMQPGAIVGWEVTPPGQSGFIAPDGTRSPHYDDQFELYYEFERKRTWFYADDVEANKQSEMVLSYAPR